MSEDEDLTRNGPDEDEEIARRGLPLLASGVYV